MRKSSYYSQLKLSNSERPTNNNLSLVKILKQASDGLLCMSESDYPFKVFLWKSENKKELTPDFILEKVGQPSDTPVEIIDIDSFFRVAITEQDWHTIEDKAIVKKYQNLVKTLKDYLKQIKVVRLGTIAIDVYIVGKTPDGDFAGLTTKVVET